MDRRAFLVRTARAGWMLLIVPAGWTAAGCGGDSTSDPPPAANPSGPALLFTSDVVAGHSHDFGITLDALTTPRTSGLAGSTTVSLDHVHAVTLTQAELAQIQAGATVTKQTSLVQGHAHTFALSFANGLSRTPTGTNGGGAGATGTVTGANP